MTKSCASLLSMATFLNYGETSERHEENSNIKNVYRSQGAKVFKLSKVKNKMAKASRKINRK